MNATLPTITADISAAFVWLLHEHHGWKRLFADICGSRAEFDSACSAFVRRRGSYSDCAPSLMTAAEYQEECENGVALKESTTHVVLDNSEVHQFANATQAVAYLNEATYDCGLQELTQDRGGHRGPTVRVDVLSIMLTLRVRRNEHQEVIVRAEMDRPDSDVEAAVRRALSDWDEDAATPECVAACVEAARTALAQLKEEEVV